MVLYDIACGLLSKSLSMGATYTLPIMLVCIWLVLHFASRFYLIVVLHSFYFIFPLGSDINCEPWAGQRPHCPSCYKQGVFLRATRGEQEQEPGHGA